MVTQQDRIKQAIRAKRINFLIAAIAVFTGGTIYILCRPSDYSFFQWIRSLGFGGELASLRTHALPLGRQIPQWMIFSLPDGLWSFAYTLIILTIWVESKSILKYVWYASIPVLVFGSEFLQGTGITGGTFCINDIILVTAGLLAGIVTVIVTLNKSHNETLPEIHYLG
jgi:hypothetical protein